MQTVFVLPPECMYYLGCACELNKNVFNRLLDDVDPYVCTHYNDSRSNSLKNEAIYTINPVLTH